MQETGCLLIGQRMRELPWRRQTQDGFVRFYIALALAIEQKINLGCRRFYSFATDGAALAAAQIVLQLKRAYPEKGIKLTLILPGKEDRRASKEAIAERRAAVKHADRVVSRGAREDTWRIPSGYAHMVAGVDERISGPAMEAVEAAKRQGVAVVVVSPGDFVGL